MGRAVLKDLQELSRLSRPEAGGDREVRRERHRHDLAAQQDSKAAGVDTVLVWAQGTPIGQLVRSMEKINYFPLTLTSWSSDNASFFDTAGKTLAEKPLSSCAPSRRTVRPSSRRSSIAFLPR